MRAERGPQSERRRFRTSANMLPNVSGSEGELEWMKIAENLLTYYRMLGIGMDEKLQKIC